MADVVTITLNPPIKRGETEIAQITLRKPTPGELRGLSLGKVMQSDIDSLITLLPRITQPGLVEAEVAAMDLQNFVTVGGEVVGFFLTDAQKAELSTMSTD